MVSITDRSTNEIAISRGRVVFTTALRIVVVLSMLSSKGFGRGGQQLEARYGAWLLPKAPSLDHWDN
jgi:hypothetical protein